MRPLRVVFGIAILILIAPLPSHPGIEPEELIPVEPVMEIGGEDGVGLKHPSDVLVSRDGRIYVLDGVNNRVVVYNPSGRFLFEFGRGGRDEGELYLPLGMAMDSKGRLYIADSGNSRVQVFSAEGRYLDLIELPDDRLRPPDPTDVIVDEKRRILYIVDNDNHRVLMYSLKDRRFIKEMGEMGMGRRGFRWPFSIAMDRDGYIYIVDVINTRVRTVTPDWRFGLDIGGWGVEKGQFFRPKGVAVDSSGRIYVSDSYLGVIQVFDRDGNFLSVVGDREGRVKRFTTPVRLYIDGRDRLFVVEMFSHRISVYRIVR